MTNLDTIKNQTSSLIEIFSLFQTEECAKKYLEKIRWGDTLLCPRCHSRKVNKIKKQKPMPYFCNHCRKYFSVRTETIMEESKISLRKWMIALYLFKNTPKGIASTRLGEYLGIQQRSAWFLLHRIREATKQPMNPLSGTVEVDETYIGGKRVNMSKYRRMQLYHLGRGSAGKIPVVGALNRETNQVIAKVVEHTDKETLHEFIDENTTPHSVVYTDEARCYHGLNREHEWICHSRRQFVDGKVHTNSIESFWARVKRTYKGTHHWMSKKHLQRYVDELVWKHNIRGKDPIEQIGLIIKNVPFSNRFLPILVSP
ncbi:MAG: IS1595 family transposase [Flavobacteriaceae bacterium]|nr:IS1595 family transposase [Flavobacteriaceae bacterium]